MDSCPHEDLETHPTVTVLVVDDEPAIREVIATLLEMAARNVARTRINRPRSRKSTITEACFGC